MRTPMRSESRPGRDRQQHRQERVEPHQRADDQRRGALRQRVQRHRDAAAGEHGVVADAQPDEREKRLSATARLPARSRREPLDAPLRRIGAIANPIVQARARAPARTR